MTPLEVVQKLAAFDITKLEVLHITVTDLKEFNLNFSRRIAAKELVLDYSAEDISSHKVVDSESL